MRFLFLLLGLLTLPALAAETPNLTNDREGTSYYLQKQSRAKAKALRQVDGTHILDAYEESLKNTEVSTMCSFDLNASLRSQLKSINPKFKQLEGAILYLRSENKFDDVVAKILLEANDIVEGGISPKVNGELLVPSDAKLVDDAVNIIGTYEKKKKSQCFDDVFRSIYGEIVRLDKNLTTKNVEALLYIAFERKVISGDVYNLLEKARSHELQMSSLTLKSYYKKRSSLRTQFPLRDAGEKSKIITQKNGKLKMSYRQFLYENYSDIQIMLMANVIKKLRARLESKKVEIVIHEKDDQIETIELQAMERFRLAVKLLRKEMALLSLNTYFNGRSPSYMDLIASSYEVGFIPASELEAVAGLQDIWNPKKTFWEKADVWIRTLSTVATVALPPPYGFIPALAVVIIEMTTGQKDQQTDDPTVLF